MVSKLIKIVNHLLSGENNNYFRLMSSKRKNIRFIEVSTGLLIIGSVLSALIAYLLSFNYTSPDASFEEDVDFLADSITRQRISSIAWIIAGSVNLFLLPFYLILFQRFQKGMHIFNGLLILAISYAFFRLGITELQIAEIASGSLNSSVELMSPETTVYLLKVKSVLLLTKIGLTCFGAFVTVFTISRFSEVKFPVLGSTLAFLAGPVVITFTWLNPDHILMTSSLAVAWTGLLMIGSRLVTRGLLIKPTSTN